MTMTLYDAIRTIEEAISSANWVMDQINSEGYNKRLKTFEDVLHASQSELDEQVPVSRMPKVSIAWQVLLRQLRERRALCLLEKVCEYRDALLSLLSEAMEENNPFDADADADPAIESNELDRIASKLSQLRREILIQLWDGAPVKFNELSVCWTLCLLDTPTDEAIRKAINDTAIAVRAIAPHITIGHKSKAAFLTRREFQKKQQ